MNSTLNNTRRQLTCVLRDLGDGTGPQYVPLNEVPHLLPQEKAFTGTFNCHTENVGPSGSHQRTVCTPLGKLSEKAQQTCVLRDLGDGTGPQYVPVNEVPHLLSKETTFTGLFANQTERHGPSGSHSRTVCTPLSRLTEGTQS